MSEKARIITKVLKAQLMMGSALSEWMKTARVAGNRKEGRGWLLSPLFQTKCSYLVSLKET